MSDQPLMNPAFKPKYWPTWLGLAVVRAFCFLPYPVIMQLGKAIGFLAYKLLKKRKRIAQTNIDACLPELSQAEREQLVKETIINTGIGLIEGLYSWWAASKTLNARTTFTGKELVLKAQAQGRGVIILGAHFTPVEFLGRVACEELQMDVTYRAQNNQAIDWCLRRTRQRNNSQLIEKTEMRKMIRNLKKGHAIWYTCDQDFGRKNSVFAPFFGNQAATLATLGRLIKMTNAKVVFIEYQRNDSQGLAKAQYSINISDPFDKQFSESDLQNATVMNQQVEQAVRKNLSQYFWVHKRFKKRPEHNAKPFYS